jgi:hypothetical protein
LLFTVVAGKADPSFFRLNLDKLFSNKNNNTVSSSTTTTSSTPPVPVPNQGDLAVDEMYSRVHVHVFDNAQQQIFELMKNDVFPRFLRKIIL